MGRDAHLERMKSGGLVSAVSRPRPRPCWSPRPAGQTAAFTLEAGRFKCEWLALALTAQTRTFGAVMARATHVDVKVSMRL